MILNLVHLDVNDEYVKTENMEIDGLGTSKCVIQNTFHLIFSNCVLNIEAIQNK